jgi:hypothetical protein
VARTEIVHGDLKVLKQFVLLSDLEKPAKDKALDAIARLQRDIRRMTMGFNKLFADRMNTACRKRAATREMNQR